MAENQGFKKVGGEKTVHGQDYTVRPPLEGGRNSVNEIPQRRTSDSSRTSGGEGPVSNGQSQ